jgi:uncharacterized protein (DUF305 family)
MFARDMIPHHQQALELSAMVPTNGSSHAVAVMAKHIALDQQAEISILSDMLTQWGERGHDHAGMHMMGGMVDPATMGRLRSLRGSDFDNLWLTAMIHHHQGAIVMAQDELGHGQNADALKMARIVIDSQQVDIAQMNHLLTTAQ